MGKPRIFSLRFFVFLSFWTLSVEGYFTVIDAYAEDCFFEKVTAGSKISLTFEVSQGGFRDIDVIIKGPKKEIYRGERESQGKYTFAAGVEGVYQCCFSNRMSTVTPKTVMFTIESGDTLFVGSDLSARERRDHVTEMLDEFHVALLRAKHEQTYMVTRERVHRDINESTNSRVVLWSIFEALVLFVVTAGQTFYLQRFFEVRLAL